MTTKVFYNGACPVCESGIRRQQANLTDMESELEWIDLHQLNEAASEIGAELEFVRERLHVVDEEGVVHVGSDAFALLWSKTKDQQALARLVRRPGTRILARWFYNIFARLLYWWNRIRRRW